MSESSAASAPSRAPVVCGALGRYDLTRVRDMAIALGGLPRPAHQDEASILFLDREPLRWTGAQQHGLGWIEGGFWRESPSPSDWKGAALAGACGLVVEGRRRYLHSSVSGLGPVYWIEDRGATYFASQMDPLVVTSPTPLSIDWDAWASIIALRYPLGDRTPFCEIRRLGPYSVLRRRFRRGHSESAAWPWAEIEPHLDLDAVAEATVAALRESLAPLEGEFLCPLSGGRDSRLLLSVLAELGRATPTAVTVSDDEGAPFEEDLAATVAQRLGIGHERIGAGIESYPAEWEERARLVEHQFVDHAWLMPLSRRIATVTSPITDGYALDVLMQTGARFHTPEVLDLSDPRAANHAMFDSLRRYGLAHLALDPRFHEPVVNRSRAQFMAVAQAFEGHPSQPNLVLYATRTLRGISHYPGGLLGRRARVLTPGADNSVASAILSAFPADKGAAGVQVAVQARVNPEVASLPSTGDTPRSEPYLPRRWRSEPAVEAHRQRLAEGPLAEYLSPELRAWLSDPARGELSPDLRLGLESVSLLHSWWDRYRAHLHGVDAADLLA